MSDKHMVSGVAAANIRPSRVIRMSQTYDFSFSECTNNVNDVPFGIAQNWTEGAPGTPFDTTYAASATKRIMVWGPGATAVAATQMEATAIQAGRLVGANSSSEIIQVANGWAVGWLMESTSPTLRWRLRVYVHPMRLSSGSTS